MDFSESYLDTVSPVSSAARVGNHQLLSELLSSDTSYSTTDNRGWTPLHEAASAGHSQCVSLLVEGVLCDINWRSWEGETPLYLACRRLPHTRDVVHQLLKLPVRVNLATNEGCTPLQAACVSGCAEVVKWLVRRGANVAARNMWGETALHCTVKKSGAEENKLEIIKYLVKHSARVDVEDENKLTCLMLAGQNGYPSVCSFLLKVNPSLVNLRAEDGATALMLAVQAGSVDCARLLLDSGADPHLSTSDGVMAVHLACSGIGSPPVLDLILSVTSRHRVNQTVRGVPVSPYHLAIDSDNYSCLDSLARWSPPRLFQVPVTCPLHLESVDSGELCPDLDPRLRCSYFPYIFQCPLSKLLSQPVSQHTLHNMSLLLPPPSSPDCVPPLLALATSPPSRQDRPLPPFSPGTTSRQVLDQLLFSVEAGITLTDLCIIAMSGQPSSLAAMIQSGLFSPLLLANILDTCRGLLTTIDVSRQTEMVSRLSATGLLVTICLGNSATIEWVRDLHDIMTSVQRPFWTPSLSILDQMYERVSRGPDSLQHLSRVAVHKTFGHRQPRIVVQTLGLPQQLVNYLLYQDLSMETLQNAYKKAVVELNNI